MKRFGGIFLLLTVMAGTAPAQARECNAVARMFAGTYCAEDIAVPAKHEDEVRAAFEKQGRDPDEALKDRNRRRLREKIWDDALARRFGANTFKPAEDEIEAYQAALEDSLDRSYEANKKTRALIEKKLAENTYAAEDEGRLRQILKSVKQSAAFYEARQSRRDVMPDKYRDVMAAARREIAVSKIRQWKIDKKLYETYNGTVVAAESGLVPVDAYEAFVDWIRKEGNFRVMDPAYRNLFGALAEPGPEDEPVAAAAVQDYFTAPERSVLAENGGMAAYETLRGKIRALPVQNPEE